MIVDENTEYTKRLEDKITEKEKTLPITYLIPKMHNNPTGARFIIVSKICSTKQISKSVSNVPNVYTPKMKTFKVNKNLNFHPLLSLLLKEGRKLLLGCLIMEQHVRERKQKGDLALVKHHLKQL